MPLQGVRWVLLDLLKKSFLKVEINLIWIQSFLSVFWKELLYGVILVGQDHLAYLGVRPFPATLCESVQE